MICKKVDLPWALSLTHPLSKLIVLCTLTMIRPILSMEIRLKRRLSSVTKGRAFKKKVGIMTRRLSHSRHTGKHKLMKFTKCNDWRSCHVTY